MARLQSRRLVTALFVVFSLLFAQLALASYVCPAQQGMEAMADRMAAGVPCEGMDPDQPVLCHEHAAGMSQSADAVKVPTLSAPLVVQVLRVPLLIGAVQAEAVPAASEHHARPPPDPLFLSTLRLRV
jgi:hypothetical protein